jgi:hypothetical protein
MISLVVTKKTRMFALANSTSASTRRKLILLFLLAGLSAGLLFGCVASNPAWESVWFRNIEYWSVPTHLYSITASVALLLALATGYVLSRYKGWLADSPSAARHLTAALLVASAVPTAAVVAEIAAPYVGLVDLLLVPVTMALLLATGMWVFTKEWSSRLTAGILTAIFLGIVIPNALCLLLRISDRSFEMLKLACLFSLVSAVCGYWLQGARCTVSASVG